MSEVGRTRVDLLYDLKRYLIGFGLLVALRILSKLGLKPPLPPMRIAAPLGLGLLLGLFFGRRDYSYPPLVYILVPEGPSSARLFIAHPSVVIPSDFEALPIGTPYGSTIRLAKSVKREGGMLVVDPHELHKIALLNPLEALAHLRSLERLAEELDSLMAKYVSLYTEVRAKARVLARKRVSELVSLERLAEKAALEELRKSIKGEEEKKL